MKTYFAISDIHSFYGPMIRALKEAGFRKTNPDHILIVCGDIFDRGPDSIAVYDFLKSIPRNRRILIKGNHEELLSDLLKSDMPHRYDYSNGTVGTVCQFTGYAEDDIRFGPYIPDMSYEERIEMGHQIWSIAKEDFKKLSVYKFLNNEKNWINYYELDKYIFVHSFIPSELKPEYRNFQLWPRYNINPTALQYMKDWREASDLDWSDARWGCPWQSFKLGLFQPETDQGKILVVGHWHTSQFYEGLDDIHENIDHCPLYNNHGLIGLDACTAATLRCNVFKFEI